MKKKYARLLLTLSLCPLVTACGTYYTRLSKFHQLFLNEKIVEADHLLAKDKRAARGRSRLLYYLNLGVTHHLLQQYKESNEFFEQAYLIYQDFTSKPVDEALSFLINPTITEYRGEDHEKIGRAHV